MSRAPTTDSERSVARTSRRTRWLWTWALAASVLASAALVGCWTLGAALVQTRLESAAARRGLEVRLGSFSLGWGSIGLNDLTAWPVGEPDVQIRVRGVSVRLGWQDGPQARSVSARQVTLLADAPLPRVRAALERIQDAAGAGKGRKSARGESAGVPVVLQAVDMAHCASEPAPESCRGSLAIRAHLEGVQWRPGDDGRSVRLLALHLGLPELPVADDDTDEAEDPAEASGAGLVAGAPGAAVPEFDALHWELIPEVSELMAWVADGHARAAGAVTRPLTVAQAEIGWVRGASRVLVGPLSVRVAADPDGSVVLEARPPSKAAESGAFEAQARLAATGGEASIRLGPVSLDQLGVQEGAFGLIDPASTRVQLAGKVLIEAGGARAEGEVRVEDLSVEHPRLARDAVRSVRGWAKGALRLLPGRRLEVPSVELSLGAVKVEARGRVASAPDHTASADVSWRVPEVSCEALFAQAPQGLLPTLEGTRWQGSFAGAGQLTVDTARPDELALDSSWDDRCVPSQMPEPLSPARFRAPFRYRIVRSNGEVAERTTGPGTAEWTPIGAVSRNVRTALLTTEDRAFFRHHGFIPNAVRDALVANLKAGRFVRGASTLSMQLTKNLFLRREKTLSRKLEEVVLTRHMERAFTKDELLELYLNVVEFGPDTYGIGSASRRAYGRPPGDLNLNESLLLTSMLPRPLRAGGMWARGALSPPMASYLQMLRKIARDVGLIGPGDYWAAVREPVRFSRGEWRGSVDPGEEEPTDGALAPPDEQTPDGTGGQPPTLDGAAVAQPVP